MVLSLRFVLWSLLVTLLYYHGGVFGVIAGLLVFHFPILRWLPEWGFGLIPFDTHTMLIERLDVCTPRKMYLIWGFQLPNGSTIDTLHTFLERLVKSDRLL
jgi:hypothetical protein